MPNFQAHFNKANKDHVCKLTPQAAGYHGAHNAVIVTHPRAKAATVMPPSTTTTTAPLDNNNIPAGGTVLFYCWTHGLSKTPLHTSALCKNKGEGH